MQNLFKLFDGPNEANMKYLKTALWMKIIGDIRHDITSNKAEFGNKHDLSDSAVEAIYEGDLSNLTLEDLFHILFKNGYGLEIEHGSEVGITLSK